MHLLISLFNNNIIVIQSIDTFWVVYNKKK